MVPHLAQCPSIAQDDDTRATREAEEQRESLGSDQTSILALTWEIAV